MEIIFKRIKEHFLFYYCNNLYEITYVQNGLLRAMAVMCDYNGMW